MHKDKEEQFTVGKNELLMVVKRAPEKSLGNKKLMYQETIKLKEKHCDVSL